MLIHCPFVLLMILAYASLTEAFQDSDFGPGPVKDVPVESSSDEYEVQNLQNSKIRLFDDANDNGTPMTGDKGRQPLQGTPLSMGTPGQKLSMPGGGSIQENLWRNRFGKLPNNRPLTGFPKARPMPGYPKARPITGISKFRPIPEYPEAHPIPIFPKPRPILGFQTHIRIRPAFGLGSYGQTLQGIGGDKMPQRKPMSSDDIYPPPPAVPQALLDRMQALDTTDQKRLKKVALAVYVCNLMKSKSMADLPDGADADTQTADSDNTSTDDMLAGVDGDLLQLMQSVNGMFKGIKERCLEVKENFENSETKYYTTEQQ